MTTLVDALATARLTRLVTRDAVLDTPRRWYWTWAIGDGVRVKHPKALDFIGCPWCVSVWAAIGVVAARRFFPKWWTPAACVLAFSQASGLMEMNVTDLLRKATNL